MGSTKITYINEKIECNPFSNAFIQFIQIHSDSNKMSKPSYSVSRYSVSRYSVSRYSVSRVPPGLTADDIADAIYVAYGTVVNVRLVPANPIFLYGGVQHAAIITMNHDLNCDLNYDFKVVYDLEAQLHFTVHKINGPHQDLDKEKERMWRWALRGIVIQ